MLTQPVIGNFTGVARFSGHPPLPRYHSPSGPGPTSRPTRIESLAMLIVDLRQVNSRQIEPLLAEEAQHWREELRWDYRASLELIKKFVDAKSLAGCAAMENGR